MHQGTIPPRRPGENPTRSPTRGRKSATLTPQALLEQLARSASGRRRNRHPPNASPLDGSVDGWGVGGDARHGLGPRDVHPARGGRGGERHGLHGDGRGDGHLDVGGRLRGGNLHHGGGDLDHGVGGGLGVFELLLEHRDLVVAVEDHALEVPDLARNLLELEHLLAQPLDLGVLVRGVDDLWLLVELLPEPLHLLLRLLELLLEQPVILLLLVPLLINLLHPLAEPVILPLGLIDPPHQLGNLLALSVQLVLLVPEAQNLVLRRVELALVRLDLPVELLVALQQLPDPLLVRLGCLGVALVAPQPLVLLGQPAVLRLQRP
mmetsp:Transcript_47789/g.119431  ORF Transcript_47789/g.119431 Transcript_47789/m.119431 type:complete len:321 (+) Transcript_47789:87-1049(+)